MRSMLIKVSYRAFISFRPLVRTQPGRPSFFVSPREPRAVGGAATPQRGGDDPPGSDPRRRPSGRCYSWAFTFTLHRQQVMSSRGGGGGRCNELKAIDCNHCWSVQSAFDRGSKPGKEAHQLPTDTLPSTIIVMFSFCPMKGPPRQYTNKKHPDSIKFWHLTGKKKEMYHSSLVAKPTVALKFCCCCCTAHLTTKP